VFFIVSSIGLGHICLMENNQKKTLSPLSIVFILSGGFFAIFLLVSAVIWFGMGGNTDSGRNNSAIFGSGKDGIGVLEIHEVIMDSKKALKVLKEFEENDRVKGVLIRLNSPGGAVAPSQEIYEAVKAFPKPVVASMESVAASGAYYIACGVERVFANSGTLTGSIGVIIPFMNLSGLLEWAKVKQYSIKTGKFKDAGATYRDMGPDERRVFQALVDDVLEQFKDAVETGRKLPRDQVTALADGRIFSGRQAMRLGLVDELGTITDASKYLAKKVGIEGEPKLIYPNERKNFRLLQYLMDMDDGDAGSDSRSTLERLVGLAIGSSGKPSAALPLNRLNLESGVYWLWDGV